MAEIIPGFTPDLKEFRNILRSQSGPVGQELKRRTLKVHAAARQGCPVKTGRLRSSIRFTMGEDANGPYGFVGTDVKYAVYVHEGTRPHEIRPRNKQALYWKGAQHPVTVVHHPGTKPNRFLIKALKAAA